MQRLQDKVAIITGGGRGIGRAIALRFGAEGARLLIADLIGGNAEKTAAEIVQAEGEARPLRVDVSRPEDVAAMIGAAQSAWNRVDILVNVAGVGLTRSLLDTTLE